MRFFISQPFVIYKSDFNINNKYEGGCNVEMQNDCYMQSERRCRKDNNRRQSRRRVSEARKKVLLVDADPQGDLTISLGWQDNDNLEITLADKINSVITDNEFDKTAGILHHEEGVDLIPSNLELSSLEIRLVNAMSREVALKEYLKSIKNNYDCLTCVVFRYRHS